MGGPRPAAATFATTERTSDDVRRGPDLGVDVLDVGCAGYPAAPRRTGRPRADARDRSSRPSSLRTAPRDAPSGVGARGAVTESRVGALTPPSRVTLRPSPRRFAETRL